MKRIFLLFFCFVAANVVLAQPNCPQPFGLKKSKSSSENRFQFTLGAGLTDLKGDKEKSNAWGIGSYLNFDYKFYRGLYAGLRSQYGELKSRGSAVDYRELDSRYFGIGAGLYIHPFELFAGEEGGSTSMGRDIIEAFYLGADALYLSNTIKSINRNNLANNSYYGPIDYYDGNGDPVFKNKVSAMILPSLNVGFAPALNKTRDSRSNKKRAIYRLVFNAQFNFANNDDLDGYVSYDQNMKRNGNGNDKYNFYSLGLRVTF